MFRLPDWHWARTRAYTALHDYKFRPYLLEEDMDEIEDIINKLIAEFANEGLQLQASNMDARIVGSVNIAYDIEDATGHVIWTSIVPQASVVQQ